jgi:hypothetical protein
MAAYLSEKMDLTPNEILFIGYKLSQVALMRMESSQAPTEEELMEMLLASGTVALAEA